MGPFANEGLRRAHAPNAERSEDLVEGEGLPGVEGHGRAPILARPAREPAPGCSRTVGWSVRTEAELLMKTIDELEVRASLISRVERLAPSTQGQWGKMTCQQMLVHVADAMERVTRGERFTGEFGSPSRLIKFIALKTPLSWPRGLPSGGDPASTEVDESGFEAERARTIGALEAMAAADGSSFSASHPAFGPMSTRDWLRWAQRHLDHHLKQFGV